MTFEPARKSIWFYKLDNEGRKKDCLFRCYKDANTNINGDVIDSHYFIVISRKNYQNYVTALPITSKEETAKDNNGIVITSNDVEDLPLTKKKFNPIRKSYVLCNKPCRILKHYLDSQDDFGKVKDEKYKELIMEVERTMI